MSNSNSLAGIPLDQLAAAVEKIGGQRAFCRKHNLPRSTLQNYLIRASKEKFRERPVKDVQVERVTTGVRRFIVSSAQDSTLIHEGFLTNLEAYAAHFRNAGQPCEIMIAGYTYNKGLFEDHAKRTPLWPKRIHNYMRWERVSFGGKVDFCAEMNTRPTAESPLSGFETYTGTRWGIFPHAKVQLKSVPTMRDDPAKIIMTTGTITKPNYVPLRAGIKAQFHHVLGAVLVEIDDEGTFFCRHLIGDTDGSFQDLDRVVDAGIVTEDNRVQGINWGDLHVAQIDPDASATAFGYFPTGEVDAHGEPVWKYVPGPAKIILDDLRPSYQFFHDVSDFQARNHHNLKDPHHQFALYHAKKTSVEDELKEVADFISATRRDWCETIIVESNHDLALKRWLKEADYRFDPQNARFFLQCQLAMYEAIENHVEGFSIFEHVITRNFDPKTKRAVRFLKTDESFLMGDIECGMHGHQGANGGPGSAKAFAKMGRKSNTGHTHSASIWDGNYCAGTTSKLFMGYNTGMSSWSISHVVTYTNGKRAILTMCNGKWRL